MAPLILENLSKLEYAQREAYNSLRSNLQFCGKDIKKIMFTSCGPAEGKSTVSFEISRSLAESGKKVVLVDTDLRKSVLMSRYGIYASDNKVSGLTHYLSGQDSLPGIVHSTNVENLSIIVSGPDSPNPSELLASKTFSDMMTELEKHFDYIIVDSAPLGLVIDAAVVASTCDGVVIVVESNKNGRRLVEDVKKQLERTGIRILGCVLNKFDETKGGYSYYSKYGKYGKYERYY